MLRSKGVAGVYDKAMDGDYQASKWLAERGFVTKKTTRRAGAPSKEEVAGEVRKEAKVVGFIDKHHERMKNKQR
jgi:hypothetical protein